MLVQSSWCSAGRHYVITWKHHAFCFFNTKPPCGIWWRPDVQSWCRDKNCTSRMGAWKYPEPGRRDHTPVLIRMLLLWHTEIKSSFTKLWKSGLSYKINTLLHFINFKKGINLCFNFGLMTKIRMRCFKTNNSLHIFSKAIMLVSNIS